jgi:hypothetical protein
MPYAPFGALLIGEVSCVAQADTVVSFLADISAAHVDVGAESANMRRRTDVSIVFVTNVGTSSAASSWT